MKKLFQQVTILAVIVIGMSFASNAQTAKPGNDQLKTYVIEREIAGAGAFSGEQLKQISQKSCGVLKDMSNIEWVHSYVTGNKIHCVYRAKNPELILEHAKKGGFPANSIAEVTTIIGPSTADN